MQLIAASSLIILPNRQRTEFDEQAIQELAESIEARGLMHAPVIRWVEGKPILVAGERRVRAIQALRDLAGSFSYNGTPVPDSMIPVVTLGELSELEAEEAELDENIKRRDLSWQELAEVHARLHKLRHAQVKAANEEAVIMEQPIRPAQTVADTAQELFGRSDGAYQDTVRKELIVAKHLDNPEVAKAKSLDDAFKVLKKQEDRRRNIELGVAIGKNFTADIHEIFQGNCLDLMHQPQFQSAFDVICTDPPYGMGADEFGDAGGKMTGIEHHYDDSYESWQKLMGGTEHDKLYGVKAWCELSYAVAKPQAHAYVFCDFDRFHELKQYMQAAGWYVFRTPLIVHKRNSGRVPRPQHGPRRQYEIILYAIKGDKTVTHIYPDVIEATADENLTHGAQKPVALYTNLLQRSVRPGDVVLDSFGGTGPVLPACHGLKCKAVVFEQSPEYIALIHRRVRDLAALEGFTAPL